MSQQSRLQRIALGALVLLIDPVTGLAGLQDRHGRTLIENLRGEIRGPAEFNLPEGMGPVTIESIAGKTGPKAILTAKHAQFELRQEFQIQAPGDRLTVKTEVTSRADKPWQLQGFGFRATGARLSTGSESDRFEAPGPFIPKNYLRPGLSVAELPSSMLWLRSAPDGGFGYLAASSTTETLSSWLDASGASHYSPAVWQSEGKVNFIFTDHRPQWLRPGEAASSSTWILNLTKGGPEKARAGYRNWVEKALPPNPDTPKWVKDMVLLEAYPEYYGSFDGLRERLTDYKAIGINTLYLMPHWQGGYSPLDFRLVNPQYGGVQDLKNLVDEAHRLGIRVLFDLVIHGMNEKSPVLDTHPEIFIPGTDFKGFARHQTWKSISTDWVKPAYLDYMADLARFDARTYGIDGYRVDAASFKNPNWDLNSPFPGYRSGADSPAVMSRMLAALRETNPKAVLLSEVFGPVFYPPSNLAHDNQTEAVEFFLRELGEGRVQAKDYQRHLRSVQELLPRGANRVYFSRNHDTSWFYSFRGYSPAFLAMEAIHAYCTIPEVFGGDPKHGPSPDDDPIVWETYRRLFATRKLLKGIPDFSALSPNPDVFVARRGKTLIYVSLASKELTLPLPAGSETMWDPLSDEKPSRSESDFVLPPFQVRWIQLGPS